MIKANILELIVENILGRSLKLCFRKLVYGFLSRNGKTDLDRIACVNIH